MTSQEFHYFIEYLKRNIKIRLQNIYFKESYREKINKNITTAPA